MKVFTGRCETPEPRQIAAVLEQWAVLFDAIRPGDTVVLKPNWLAPSHKFDRNEWRSVITNPEVITAVLEMVLPRLGGSGKVVLTDGPQTDSSWQAIMARMEPRLWIDMGLAAGVSVEILDLREQEWVTRGDVNVERRNLPGDPKGSTVCDLGSASEFAAHRPSQRGYYGADYNPGETNRVHSGGVHKYKVSRTVIEADVFVNIPKMKTHKKAGITCSLKNLVGINTYKNWLPHHSEGTPDEGGDAYPASTAKNKLETTATASFKALLMRHPQLGKWMIPVKSLGKRLFGSTQQVIRSGNWYGNDTLWRMVLDLNKILLYAQPDGSLRNGGLETRKRYISIVDGIVAGEGNGPEAPTPRNHGVLIGGVHPVAVDAVCAHIMGFDWRAIPCIRQAFAIEHLPLCDFSYEDIVVDDGPLQSSCPLSELQATAAPAFKPHFGWTGHIELERPAA
jgi:uncharacterized protein (DUF362 family)